MDNIPHGNLVGNVTLKDIYIIKNTVNDKVYIGQSKDAANRWKFHKTAANTGHYKGRNVLYRAMRDIGIDKFYYEILEKQIPNYNEREIYWIDKYNSIAPNGYNILSGGEQYPNLSGIKNSGAAVQDQETLDAIIFDLRHSNDRLTELALKYNVPINTIHCINSGATYFNQDIEYPIRKKKIPVKLTDNNVSEIIGLLLGRSLSIMDIAKKYSVSEETINCINVGQTHKNVCANIERPFRKGSSPKPRALTNQQVDEIIDLLLHTSLSYREIGRRFGVEHSIIIRIKNGSRVFKRDNLTYPLRPNN